MLEHFEEYEYHLAQIQLVLFMLGMGATLSPRDFLAIARKPRFLLVGAACQVLLTPILAVFLNRWMDL
jgi:bile acid:Na+ symporter, BASS family